MSAPLALTMGEPGGVAIEITAKAWSALRETGPVFYLVGDGRLAETASSTSGAPSGVSTRRISAPGEANEVFANALPVLDIGAPVDATPGRASPENAAAVIAAIERAVADALEGAAAGVVTNPIQKASLQAAGFAFPGHTEFLAELTRNAPLPAGATRGPVMMLAGPDLRAVPVTIHQSVREAVESLSVEQIVRTGRIVAEALARDFATPAPRLAVSGLNPHAGEEGRLGREDIDIIRPAVEALRADGVDARGPLAADTMFHPPARASYDAALCMLHDQALIPAKTLAFDESINVTLGLPIVRTSPDHGTALDIAGRGLARADSLVAALRLAARLAEGRAREGNISA